MRCGSFSETGVEVGESAQVLNGGTMAGGRGREGY